MKISTMNVLFDTLNHLFENYAHSEYYSLPLYYFSLIIRWYYSGTSVTLCLVCWGEDEM